MKRELIFSVMALGLILAIEPCMAAGALAVGLPSDVSKDGVLMWATVGAATTKKARDGALAGCKALTKTPAMKNLCKVVATFSNQCTAQALDPQNGTPGWGYAIANNLVNAKNQALANCRATAGPTRQDACVIVKTSDRCDGAAR
jgi:hypothetical protein